MRWRGSGWVPVDARLVRWALGVWAPCPFLAAPHPRSPPSPSLTPLSPYPNPLFIPPCAPPCQRAASNLPKSSPASSWAPRRPPRLPRRPCPTPYTPHPLPHPCFLLPHIPPSPHPLQLAASSSAPRGRPCLPRRSRPATLPTAPLAHPPPAGHLQLAQDLTCNLLGPPGLLHSPYLTPPLPNPTSYPLSPLFSTLPSWPPPVSSGADMQAPRPPRRPPRLPGRPRPHPRRHARPLLRLARGARRFRQPRIHGGAAGRQDVWGGDRRALELRECRSVPAGAEGVCAGLQAGGVQVRGGGWGAGWGG